MIICALAGLLTPIGDTPYTYLYKTMQGNTTNNISEHLPLTLIENTEAICMLIIFLAILIFTKTKIKLSDLFMIGGLCYLMFSCINLFSNINKINCRFNTKIYKQWYRTCRKGCKTYRCYYNYDSINIIT